MSAMSGDAVRHVNFVLDWLLASSIKLYMEKLLQCLQWRFAQNYLIIVKMWSNESVIITYDTPEMFWTVNMPLS